jgi:NADH-quinone oxidoreductase subunit C
MTPAEIGGRFKEHLGDRVLEVKEDGIYPYVKVRADAWTDAARFARDVLLCETLHDLTAIDDKAMKILTVDARVWSYSLRHWVNLRTEVDRADPRVASLQPLWRAADWHERECWDMLGVRFEGHPNLTRILCAEDWVGHPLRKDYVFPDYYHGIPGIPVMRARDKARGRVFPPPKAAVPAKPAAAVAAKPAAPPAEGGAS